MLEVGRKDNKVIFGCSDVGGYIYEELITQGEKEGEIYFCDNSEKKIGEKFFDKTVLSVKEAVETVGEGTFFIGSIYHYPSMKEQLLHLGVSADRIMKASEAVVSRKEENDAVIRTTPRKQLCFETYLTDHCNLNCRSCNAFSPLAEENYADLDRYIQDFQRLSQIFNGEAERIYLLGGEPLLNPNIEEYIVPARKNFPQANISIVTNGILLSGMKESFWKCCRNNNITICITKYPIRIKINEILNLAQQYDVKITYFGNALDYKYMYHFPLDLEGKQDMNNSFQKCMNANKCITLREGKLYTCSIAPNAVFFSKRFNQLLEITQDDYIDIYKTDNKEEILNFLSKPIPFCRYCKVCDRTYDKEWGLSAKDIHEWT